MIGDTGRPEYCSMKIRQDKKEIFRLTSASGKLSIRYKRHDVKYIIIYQCGKWR